MLADSAKIGILIGSAVAGIAGYLFLRAIPAAEPIPAAEAVPTRKWTVRVPERSPAGAGSST